MNILHIRPRRLHVFHVTYTVSNQFGITSLTYEHSHSSRVARFGLKQRLAAPLIAVCADHVGRLAIIHSRSKLVSKDAIGDLSKLIPFLLAAPVFKLCNSLFQIAHALGEFRLHRLGRHCTSLSRHDLRRQLDSFFPDKLSVANAEQCLRQIRAGLEGTQEARNG